MPRKATPTPAAVSRALRQTGTHLSDWRRLQGLTEAEVADRAGIARLTLRRIEAGEPTSFENVLRVARSLGVMQSLVTSLDPLETDLGKARALDLLPSRTRRPRRAPRP